MLNGGLYSGCSRVSKEGRSMRQDRPLKFRPLTAGIYRRGSLGEGEPF
jgi:hypothetical protein